MQIIFAQQQFDIALLRLDPVGVAFAREHANHAAVLFRETDGFTNR